MACDPEKDPGMLQRQLTLNKLRSVDLVLFKVLYNEFLVSFLALYCLN